MKRSTSLNFSLRPHSVELFLTGPINITQRQIIAYDISTLLKMGSSSYFKR